MLSKPMCEPRLIDLLECAKRAEEVLSWLEERGGKITYSEEDLQEFRRAFELMSQTSLGLMRPARGAAKG
jgi:hypothetical protein